MSHVVSINVMCFILIYTVIQLYSFTVAVYCRCPEYDQCLDELLSVMNTIPALKEIELALRFFTAHGASSILHLIQTSSSLCKTEWVRNLSVIIHKRFICFNLYCNLYSFSGLIILDCIMCFLRKNNKLYCLKDNCFLISFIIE